METYNIPSCMHMYICKRPNQQKLLIFTARLNQVEFKISQLAISGLKVNRLDMYGEVSRVCWYLTLTPPLVFVLHVYSTSIINIIVKEV